MSSGAIALSLQHAIGGYQEHAPPPALAAVSDAVWIYRTPTAVPPAGAAMHRVLPDPAFGFSFCCYRDRGGRPVEPRLLMIGPVVTPRLAGFRPEYEIATVMVKREWVRPLFGLAPDEHDDFDDDVSLVHPRLAEDVFGRLTETRAAPAALAVLTAAVARLARRGSAYQPGVATRALDVIRRTGGTSSLDRVADLTGFSVRHLRRLVRRDAGVSLKTFARTLRLIKAITAADRTPRGQRPSWSRVATEAGYCDQSHLSRDLHELCGATLTQVYRERRAQVTPAAPPDLILDGRNLQDI